MSLASYASTTFAPDGLLLGPDPTVSRSITLLSGQTCLRGALLGKITSGGKYILSLSGASDGSQTPDCILAEDCDAAAGDKVTVAYFVADVNENKVIFGTAHTAASVKEGLRLKSINLISAQVAY